MEWFKFYSSRWLSDLAIKQLSAVDRLIFVTLLCVTNVTDETEERNGVIKNFSEHAIISLTGLEKNTENEHLCEVQNAYGFTKRMEKLGLIELMEDGNLLIKGYKKRQNSNLSGAERQKRFRQKNVKKNHVTNVTQGVTEQRNDSNARVEKSRVEYIYTQSDPVTVEKKKDQPKKETFGELGNVKLTNQEYEKLVSNLDEKFVNQMIFELDTYVGSTGKRYKSHYATILSWAKRKYDNTVKVKSNIAFS